MVERKAVHKTLKTYDIAIVPLKTRIYGSVPSKIFEYSSLGFPILYFGGGEGEKIVEENNLGWVAKVADYNDLNKKLVEISQVSKSELDTMKKQIFNHQTQKLFNLDNQIKELIDRMVF